MRGEILTSMEAAAYGARLAGVEKVPDFPAPFSVEITRALKKLSQNCDVFEVESVSSAMAAAVGASSAGKRVFVPMSSVLAHEAFTAPFMRLPFLVVNVSRSLHNVNPDHSAAMSLRDSGYLMFFPESNQEIYDSVVLGYKVAEDPKVLLPAVVNIDGPSSFMEPVVTATDQSMKGFLSAPQRRVDVKRPSVLDVYQDNYGEFRMSQHKAMENALEAVKKTGEKWQQKFRRNFSAVEKFMVDDAETLIVTMGYHSSTAKAAAGAMRTAGKKVGVLRIRIFRPWPASEVAAALERAKKVLVFDQAASVGLGGILSAHIKRPVSSLICLGKYPSEKDFANAVEKVEKSTSDLKLWM